MALEWSPLLQSSPAFEERLHLELSLTLGTESVTIPGGQVKHVSAQVFSHGFTASVTFWTRLETEDAPLHQAFLKPDLIRVRLAISGVYDVPTQAPPPLVLQGIVRTRSLGSQSHGSTSGSDKSFRRYTIEFADAAQVLWRQHRPTELYTDKKMSEVIQAHRVDPIQLSCEWDVLDAQQPLICLALGEDAPSNSFYDFVLWFVHAHGGVWLYDSQKDKYVLAKAKPHAGQPASLGATEVQQVQVALPPVPRHGTRVLNTFAVGPTTTPLEQPQAATGLWHDVLLRTPIANDAERRQTLEKQRLQLPKDLLKLGFNRLPSVPVHPGATLSLEGSLWPPGLKGAGKPQRVRELSLETVASDPSPEKDSQMPTAGYRVRLSTLLEPESELIPLFPPFQRPRYPIFVEGKMHSPGGEEKDKSYFLVEDEKNSLLTWRVAIPLWNKTVSVPAQPGHFPGHFYFPPYKNHRVLVALYLDHAELERSLDWGDTVRLPQDGQGDQSLLGKNKTSQTAITHDYQENKPVWTLARTSANDLQTVRIAEGTMLLQVKEDPAAASSEPTFDVTPQVEAAKGELASSVGGSVGEVTGAYQSSMTAVSADIQAASEESMAALEAANAEISAQVAESRSQLTGALSKLSESGAAVGGAAAEAKATLQGLV